MLAGEWVVMKGLLHKPVTVMLFLGEMLLKLIVLPNIGLGGFSSSVFFFFFKILFIFREGEKHECVVAS